MESTLSYELQAKKLGGMIENARTKAGKSVQECAHAIGVTDEIFLANEAGEASLSLPEIELLAYFLKIPLEYFWGGEIPGEEQTERQPKIPQTLLGLRQRMIGALLRKARMETNTSLGELTNQTGIAEELIQAYELGSKPIPLPELDTMAAALGYSIRHFQDQRGPIGAWMMEQRALADFKKLPPEMQAFVSKPVNRPYLEMAQRMSEMSVEKLRAVAEGLLEITL